MTYRRILIGWVLFGLAPMVVGQSHSRNAGYVELLGNGGNLISLNYERQLWTRPADWRFTLTARAGLSLSFNQYDHAPIVHMPIEVCAYRGVKRWRPELGIGYTAFVGSSDLDDKRIPAEYKSNYASWQVIRIGIRYMGYGGGLIRFAPMYIWESHSNGRRSSFWGAGLAVGTYL